MSKYQKIELGTNVKYMGRTHKVSDFKAPFIYLTRDGDKNLSEVKLSDFFNYGYSSGLTSEVVSVKSSLLAEASNKKREKAYKKREIIQPLLDFQYVNNSNQLTVFLTKYSRYFMHMGKITRIWKKDILQALHDYYKISKRQIRRYFDEYIEGERSAEGWGDDALIDSRGDGYKSRNDNKEIIIYARNSKKIVARVDIRIGSKQAEILQKEIEKQYLTVKRISSSAIITNVKVQCSKGNIECPAESTLYGIIRKIRNLVSDYRDDESKRLLNHDVQRGFTNEVGTFPLSMVVIDHKLLDVLVIDDKTGDVIGRPWLTVGIDCFSRAIWGFYLSFDQLSIDRLIKLYENGLFIKHVKEKYNLLNEWEVFGKPSCIYFDNGKDFKSIENRRMVNDVIGAEIMFRPRRIPQYGAVIERFFKTLDLQLIHTLDGTTKGNPQNLGDYTPEKYAKYTLQMLEVAIYKYIVDQYNFQRHSELPLDSNTPMTRYFDGINAGGLPEYVDQENEARFRFDLMREYAKKYTSDGITFCGVRYKSPELTGLISKTNEYRIKYSNDDISFISVQHPKTKQYVIAPAVEPEAQVIAGMNRYYYNWLIKDLKDHGELKNKSIPGTQMIIEAQARIIDYLNSEMPKSRKAVLKGQRAYLLPNIAAAIGKFQQNSISQDTGEEAIFAKYYEIEKKANDNG